jgi:hypothetical protein
MTTLAAGSRPKVFEHTAAVLPLRRNHPHPGARAIRWTELKLTETSGPQEPVDDHIQARKSDDETTRVSWSVFSNELFVSGFVSANIH